MSNDKNQKIFLPGAYKLDRKGQPVAVDAIEAPEPSSCCKLDCCNNRISFLDSNGVQRHISLQALYDLLNP